MAQVDYWVAQLNVQVKNISVAIGISQNTVYQQLFKLKNDGMVQQDSQKQYALKIP